MSEGSISNRIAQAEHSLAETPVKTAHITLLLITTATAVFYGFISQALAFTAPAMARQWLVAPTAFAPAFSSTLLGMMVGSIVFGTFADRWGKQLVLIFCGILLSVSTLALPLFQSPLALIPPRLVAGFALGGMLPPLIALVSEFSPRSVRSLYGNVALAGVPLGGLIGSLLTTLLEDRFGWPAVYILTGIGAALMAGFTWMLVPESVEFLLRVGNHEREAEKTIWRFSRAVTPDIAESFEPNDSPTDDPHGSWMDMFRDGRAIMTILFWVAEFVALMGYYILVNWVPTLLVQSGFSPTEAAYGAAALNFGGVTFGFLVGALSDRFGARPVMVAALTLGGASLFLIAITHGSTPLLLLSIFLAGGAWIAGQAGMLVLISGSYPSTIRSISVGLTLTVGRIGSILSPAVVAIPLAAGWSTGHILLLPVIPALIAAVCVWRARPSKVTNQRQPSVSPIS